MDHKLSVKYDKNKILLLKKNLGDFFGSKFSPLLIVMLQI